VLGGQATMELLLDEIKNLGVANVHAVAARPTARIEEEWLILSAISPLHIQAQVSHQRGA
jgi:hypothetical protein